MIPTRGSWEKFLHHESVERVLYRESMEDCADPSLGIKHHNDSYAMVAWRSSYTVEVWKWSYTVEAWKIVLIRCWVSSIIMDSYAMVAWKSSYTVEVWKGSYTMKAWKIVLIRCWVSSTIMIPTLW